MKNRAKSTNRQNPPQKPQGRVAGRQRTEWPVLKGMKHAAGILHAPYEVIRQLRESGAAGFLSDNRMDTGIVVPQIFDVVCGGQKLPAGCASWKEAGEKYRSLIAKHELELSEKLSIPAAEAQRQANECGGYMFGELERMVRELPPALAGLSTPEVHKRLRLEVERVRTELKLKLNEVGK